MSSIKDKLLSKKVFSNKRSFIILLLICMGIGFAYLSSNLTINGNTSVSGNKWSVYFDNIVVSDGSVEASVEPTIDTTKTRVDYTLHLSLPGDFYEFTVDAKNDGTIDAMIETITKTQLTTDVLKYLNYTVTYLDGSEISQNDVLEANDSTTYKVRLEYRKDISSSDLSQDSIDLSLTFGIDYIQSTIKKAKPVEFVKMIKTSALSDSSIDFQNISSDDNGKGLYIKSDTINDTNPIYYYRGNVTNNNAKFAGFCWKIVRTTETGGTKLIYNGLPDGEGNCTNTTGEATQLSTTTAFNESRNSLAYDGYMYGDIYEYQSKSVYSDSYMYANSFSYENGTYTLTGSTISKTFWIGDSDLNNRHYTCFNTTGTCTGEIYYVYYLYCYSNTTAFLDYITIKDGKTIADAIEEMRKNTTNSAIKSVLDSWFDSTIKTYFTTLGKNYNSYLEDTVWCNDKSSQEEGSYYNFVRSGWYPNGGSPNIRLRYGIYTRRANGTPTLTCNNKNDAFTVNDTTNGNGALIYPIGLLTADEVILAGGSSANNDSYYLYTNLNWWTMTPYEYQDISNVSANGSLSWAANDPYYSFYGVRPSISIASSVKIAVGGDGTATAPYEFLVN